MLSLRPLSASSGLLHIAVIEVAMIQINVGNEFSKKKQKTNSTSFQDTFPNHWSIE